MTDRNSSWHPGSFTKNFSWGPLGNGLKALHDSIRIGFAEELTEVPREQFRNRLEAVSRPDFIPANFFVFNQIRSGVSWICVDELIFQALNFEHSRRFDNLAIFAFNMSLVGSWKGSKADQSSPALWARYYYADKVADSFNWNTNQITADDIQNYLKNSAAYQGKTTRKLATNLNYLYKQGISFSSPSKKVTQWWVDCVFLALDRIVLDRKRRGLQTKAADFPDHLEEIEFTRLTGGRSIAKDLALKHLINLYEVCGRNSRFSDEAVRERQNTLLPEIQEWANNPEPIGVAHKTDPNIFKTIPRVCAVLAATVGFIQTDAVSFDDFDIDEFVRKNVQNAVRRLEELGISTTMSVEDLLRITREE